MVTAAINQMACGFGLVLMTIYFVFLTGASIVLCVGCLIYLIRRYLCIPVYEAVHSDDNLVDEADGELSV